ncbi:MAG TPA: ribonuclease P protein component [Bacteroidetes bacterium]|nr:ribonuclease P protein component [Bacteroidota bacterium]
MSGEPITGSATPQTFKKAERLTSKKIMDELFNRGSSFVLYPFRVGSIEHDYNVPSKVQVLISVPKKNFPLAVHRNRIKRLIREAYRKNKFLLIEKRSSTKKNLAFSIVFTDKKLPDYFLVEEKIIALLTQLSRQIK